MAVLRTTHGRIPLAGDGAVTYHVVGEGDPLIWFEGGPGFPADLGLPDAELLSARFRTYLVDPPGLGGSRWPDHAPQPDHLGHAWFVEQARTALGLPPVLAVGHSWGGLVALTYAAAFPGSVTGCVAVDGFAGDPSVDPDAAQAERDRALARHRLHGWPLLDRALELERQGIEWGATRPTDPEGVRWRLSFADPESEAALLHAARLKRAEPRMNRAVITDWYPPGPFADVDLRPMLPQVRCPVLVAVGRHDPLCGPVWAEPIVAGLRGAGPCRDEPARVEEVVFELSGHCPQYEQPEEFLDAVLDWYDRAVAAPGRPSPLPGSRARA